MTGRKTTTDTAYSAWEGIESDHKDKGMEQAFRWEGQVLAAEVVPR